MNENKPIHVVGGGLAGSEAAWQVARAGVPVVLHEMRPERMTEAHQGDDYAELVCSNSFRSDDAIGSAIGLLHEEMRRCNSLIMAAADANKVPAGSALAMDRYGFLAHVGSALKADPLVKLKRGEVGGLPPDDWDNVIIATGPLTSPRPGGRHWRINRRRATGLFRRNCANRLCGQREYGYRLVPVPL